MLSERTRASTPGDRLEVLFVFVRLLRLLLGLMGSHKQTQCYLF